MVPSMSRHWNRGGTYTENRKVSQHPCQGARGHAAMGKGCGQGHWGTSFSSGDGGGRIEKSNPATSLYWSFPYTSNSVKLGYCTRGIHEIP